MLLGRAAELDALRSALDAAAQGAGALVLVRGPAGVGKSALIEAFAQAARDAGAVVAFGRAFEFGGAPAYWPWIEALQDLGRAVHAAAVEEALAKLSPGQGETTERADGRRFWQFESVRRALAASGERATTAVLLEDVHAADTSTLRLASFLAKTTGRPRTLLVLTARESAAEAASADVAGVLADLRASCITVDLSGLDAESVAKLAEQVAGTSLSGPAVRAVLDATGGNPFFVEELVSEARRTSRLDDLAGGRFPSSGGIRELARRQLERLDEHARRALRAAAVCGRSTPTALLARVLEVEQSRVLDAVTQVGAEPLVRLHGGAVVFVHALVPEAIATELSPTDRLRLHARVVEAMLESPSEDPARLASLARHACAAAPLGPKHRERALEIGRSAGEAAMRSLAYEEATRCFEHALATYDESGGPEAPRAEILVALGEALHASGAPQRAADCFGRAAAIATSIGDARLYARAALGCASTREFMTSDLGMVRMLERATRDLGGDESALRVRVLGRLARDLVMVSGSLVRRQELSRHALALARKVGTPDVLAAALHDRLSALYGPDNLDERRTTSDEILGLAREMGDPELELIGLAWKLSALLEMGQTVEARRFAHEHARLADVMRLPGARINAASRLAALAFLEGRWEEGFAHAGSARDIGRLVAGSAYERLYAAQVALPCEFTGRVAELEALLPTLDSEGPRMHTPRMVQAIAMRARLVLGRVAEARAAFDAASAEDYADVPDDFVRLGTLCTLAWVCAKTGDRARAPTLARLLEPYRGRVAFGGTSQSAGAVSLYLGLLSGAMGDDESAQALLADASREHRAMGALPFVVLTDFERAEVADRLGRGALAGELRESAGAMAGTLSMASFRATRASGEDRPPGAPAHPQLATLRREGDYWTIALNACSVRIRHQRGLTIIARLVQHPGQDVHALDLAGGGSGAEAAALRDESGTPLLDVQARAELSTRLEDLDEVIGDAEACNDLGRAERARREREAIAEHLASSLGLGGRSRRASDATERARVAVAVAVKRAIASIDKHLPVLAAHFSVSIRTGALCRYAPDPSASLRVTT